jgi:hypothetical protein
MSAPGVQNAQLRWLELRPPRDVAVIVASAEEDARYRAMTPLLCWPLPGRSWPGFPSETQLDGVFALCGRAKGLNRDHADGLPERRCGRPPAAAASSHTLQRGLFGRRVLD